MSSQLEQLFGYLERDGVTEVLFGSGRPIAMRKAGALTNITARPLSADQLAAMLRGSEINALIPSVDGEGPTGQVIAGRRTATAKVARRGHEIVISLTRPDGGTVTAASTAPLARSAGAAGTTPGTGAPMRAKSPTSSRAKTPTSAPRAKTPTRSKEPSGPQRAKSGTAVRVKSSTSAPRTKSPTVAPRKKTPTTAPKSRTTTATRAGGLVPPARAPAPPAATNFDFSLDDGIELGEPLVRGAAPAPAAPADDGITLGGFGADFELELGAPVQGAGAPPPTFDVDFSTSPPQAFDRRAPPPPGGLDVDFSTNQPQPFGGAAAKAAGGRSSEPFTRLNAEPFAKPRETDEGFARPRSNEVFAKPSQNDDGFARPRSTDGNQAKPNTDAFGRTQPLGPPASHASTQPFGSTPGRTSPPVRGHDNTQPIEIPIGLSAHDRTQQFPAIRGNSERLDGTPQAIGNAGTQPLQAIPELEATRASARIHSPVFASIVQAARELGASDLHIAAARVTSVRTNGQLVPLEPGSNPLSAQGAEEILLTLLDPEQEQQLGEVGYVDLALDAPGGGRLRANISRQQQGLKGTFRLALAAPATLDELGLPAELAKVVGHHQGLVVIAGPSGHGKTTTLAALVDLLNSSKPYHILTIEDPVEIIHERKQAVISQREAGRHTESFARGLKASLREDPDVIVIGELRDRESVEIALTAAETGHLVIATMSTPSAAKTIDRLIDMFPPEEHSQVRASIAGALRAIVAQRLLPKVGGGIVPAIELVTGVLPLAVLIRDDKLYQLPNLMQRGRAFGMIRFDESLAEHVRAGRIDEQTALDAADSKKELAAVLHPPAPAAAAKTSPIWGFGKKDNR